MSLPQSHIAVGLSGGVACYKVASLISQLVKSDAKVRALMSPSAKHFIGPATLAALSGHTVLSDIWQIDDQPQSQHIGTARWCDLFIVAPGSADMIAKIAQGRCDDVVSLTVCALPNDTPLLIAPAMNSDMWANPAVQRNIALLKQTPNYHLVGPEEGWQACRTVGVGRMSEPEQILEAAKKLLENR